MSNITNNGLTRSGAGRMHYSCTHNYSNNGRQRVGTSNDNGMMTAGIKDIVPQVLPDSGCYEGFEDLADRANAWLKDQKSDMIVSNMQSIMVLKDDGQYQLAVHGN